MGTEEPRRKEMKYSHPVFSLTHAAGTTNITTAGIEIAQASVVQAGKMYVANSTGQVIQILFHDAGGNDTVLTVLAGQQRECDVTVSEKQSIYAKALGANATTGHLCIELFR